MKPIFKNLIGLFDSGNEQWKGRSCSHILIFSLTTLIILSLGSCSKVLDKNDLTSFNAGQVYNDSLLARAYVDYIYDQNSPTWPTGDWLKCTEEISGETIYFDGLVQVNSVTDYGISLVSNGNWGKIRAINQFLQDMPKSTLSDAYKKSLMAQAKFFRAYRYFELVKLYGGVPLVLAPQAGIGAEAKAESTLPRNKTSECIAQIVKDLDEASADLPGQWTGTDWGRITSGAALALKGRVLLTYASPQFNPNDLVDRWQASYDANTAATALLTANGFGLYPDYQNMWFKESGNSEAVWSVGYNNSSSDQLKKNDTWDNGTRPSYLGTGGGANQPVMEIVNSYPMKDGKKIDDPTGAYTYNPQLFYKNRDPRFYATIGYNGCVWPINGISNYHLWTYYAAGKSVETKASSTGFYCRKAIDPNIPVSNVQYAGTDWIELRYAEVVLNLAESACGINKLDEAYKGVEAIRKRAGIPAGSDGLYGLKPNMTRAEMFKAILAEREVEFAFEGKRFWDLRRWKLFESTLNGKSRTSLRIDLNSNITASQLAASRDTMNLDSMYTKYFTFTFKPLDTKYLISWQPNYYFFALPQQAIDNDPKLIQNTGWNDGTFDPLQ